MARTVPRALPRTRVWVDSSTEPLALAEVADTAASRSHGLLGRDGLAPGDGLILDPCRLIHTFFMRFAIDVVFFDRHHRVTRVAREVRPFRFAWGGWSARVTLELPAGTLARIPVGSGAQLRFEPIVEPIVP
jgi:uncharacterized membrane protein (UPF0127 family)